MLLIEDSQPFEDFCDNYIVVIRVSEILAILKEHSK